MSIDTNVILQQIDAVLSEANSVGGSGIPDSMGTDGSSNDQQTAHALALVSAALDRLAPPGGYHALAAQRLRESSKTGVNWTLYHPLVGVLKALRSDYAAGRLVAVRELIHGELFSDFLDAAQHLLDEGYKDPAAVIAGSSLEAHLRKIADKASVPTNNADGSAKKASLLSAELAKTTPPALSKLDAKNVTSWLDTRNNAAHGHYDRYTKEQVGLLIQSVRDFITRVPA